MLTKRWMFLVFAVHIQVALSANLFIPSPAMTPLRASNEPGQVLVFVSSSMPRASLIQWFIQAQQLGATVILRGLVDNSLPKTKVWMEPLIEQANNTGGIEINPVAFEAYHITQVPAVAVTTSTLQCVSNEQCITPSFDVVTGNTSLPHALKVIAEKGDVGKLIAQQTLAQMKEAP